MSEANQQLGPFQNMARNLGIEPEIVAKLPFEWPICSDHSLIADALYDAGYPPGNQLIGMAKRLWNNRPSYRRDPRS